MELLANIIRCVDPTKFQSYISTSKQLVRLYELLTKEEIVSNKILLEKLYGTGANKEAFKQIKLRLESKLLEYIAKHGVTVGSADDYAMQYMRCINEVSAIKMLIFSGSRDSATALAERTLPKLIKNSYTELCIILVREMLNYYSINNYDKIKRDKYLAMLTYYENLYLRELKAAKCICELRVAYNKSIGRVQNEVLKKAVAYCETLKEYLDQNYRSYRLISDSYGVLAMRYEMEGKYEDLISVCSEALQLLADIKICRRVDNLMFDVYKIVAYIQLKEYVLVDKISNQHFKIMTSGIYNWVVLKLYVFISKLHSGHYHEANEILNEVIFHKTHTRLPESIREVWKVYHAYMEYLGAMNLFKAHSNTQTTFRLNKFLNEVPIYTKDKRGLNIAILIIQVLFLLQQHKYSQIIDRAESLKLYCYRYLRKNDTFRSHCFIRMLLQMPKADFNRIRTERYAEPYLKKLQSVPLKISQQSIEVEVIPYEDLWGITLDLLD